MGKAVPIIPDVCSSTVKPSPAVSWPPPGCWGPPVGEARARGGLLGVTSGGGEERPGACALRL